MIPAAKLAAIPPTEVHMKIKPIEWPHLVPARRMAELEARIASLETDAKIADDVSKRFAAENSELKKERKRLAARNSRIVRVSREHQRAIEGLRSQLDEATKVRDMAQRRAYDVQKDSERKIGELVDKLRAARDAARGFAEECTGLSKELAGLQAECGKLKAECDALQAENERLLGLLADPKLISVEVDKRGVEIKLQPREEIMRHLFLMMAHALSDTPNYIETAFGPDPKTGESYVLTLRRHHGKTPAQLHEEQVTKLKAERDQAIDDRIDLIHLCEKMLRAWGDMQSAIHADIGVVLVDDGDSRVTVELENAIKSIRAHVSPAPENKDNP
jgi:hypothetical protein